MTKDASILLDRHSAEFVKAKIDEGQYSTADDVVRAALRLLEDQDAQLQALRAALIEGEESGPPQDFDFDVFLARMHASE